MERLTIGVIWAYFRSYDPLPLGHVPMLFFRKICKVTVCVLFTSTLILFFT